MSYSVIMSHMSYSFAVFNCKSNRQNLIMKIVQNDGGIHFYFMNLIRQHSDSDSVKDFRNSHKWTINNSNQHCKSEQKFKRQNLITNAIIEDFVMTKHTVACWNCEQATQHEISRIKIEQKIKSGSTSNPMGQPNLIDFISLVYVIV